MKIIKLNPAFKDYLWGGTKLRDIYNKKCSYDKVAESWELSTHSAGESIVAQGEFKGDTLSMYIKKCGAKVLGSNCNSFDDFPVLIKFIDAKDALSIQVHPSDEYALRVEKEYGKTEMWYVMDCDPGAALCFGVNREITKEEFAKKLADNTIMDVMNKVEVHKGDVFFIEAGTIHAIGAGTMICEIQQNSNTTYRVYDYARVGNDGKQRELHIDKALDVSKLTPSKLQEQHTPSSKAISGGAFQKLASCKYFTTNKYTVETQVSIDVDEKSFMSIMILSGVGKVAGSENQVDFIAGDSIFIPANSGKVTIEGQCQIITTKI